MKGPEGSFGLPRVTEEDLALVLSEAITDPDHRKRWQEFAHRQPELAREIERLAFAQRLRLHEGLETPVETQQSSIDIVTLVIRALQIAGERKLYE